MFYQFQNRLILHGALTATTALRIGTGRTTDSTETDLPVIKDTLGKPYIPGSSFKGVLRSRCESLLRTLLGARGACNPLLDAERCIPPETIEQKKRKLAQQERTDGNFPRDQALTDWVEQKTCLACLLFGSPWLAARVQIRDWLVDERFWFSQYMVRDGVSIDRDTETAGEGLLYSYEVIPAGTRFAGQLLVENAEPWQLGLLFAGLNEFDHGLPLGGATSRGLGGVQLDWDWDERSRYIAADHLWDYLEDAGTAGVSPEELQDEWKAALIDKLREAAVSA